MSEILHIKDLRDRGVIIDQVTAPAEGLDNFDIHPIWAQDNWMARPRDWHNVENNPGQFRRLVNRRLQDGAISDASYERMKPALRLATLLLRASVDFAIDIAFGDRSRTDQNGRPIIQPYGRYGATEQARLENEVLGPLSQCIFLQFSNLTKGHQAWGITSTPQITQSYTLMAFDEGFLAWICDNDFDQRPLQNKQIQWWVFATTAVHELMHAINQQSTAFATSVLEAWTFVDTSVRRLGKSEPEFGEAWERWFFGDRVTTEDIPPQHFFLSPYPSGLSLSLESATASHRRSVPVTIGCASQFFDGAKWRQHLNRNSTSVVSSFRVEAVSVNGFGNGIAGFPCRCAEQHIDLLWQTLAAHPHSTFQQKEHLTKPLMDAYTLQAHGRVFPPRPARI